MTLFHPNVLSLLIGVPAAIALLVYLAVALLKRRRDANWARANDLEQTPQTEAERGALEEYDQRLDGSKPHGPDEDDEEFYQRSVIEGRLQKLPSLDTEFLSGYTFSVDEYPTYADRTRLVSELHKRNPHVRGLTRDVDGYKATFGQIPSMSVPEPRCSHGLKPDRCVNCHVCQDFLCHETPRCHMKHSMDKKVDKDCEAYPDLCKTFHDHSEPTTAEREQALKEREERIARSEQDLVRRQKEQNTDDIRALYKNLSNEKLAKAVKILPLLGDSDNAPAHLAADRAEAQERVKAATQGWSQEDLSNLVEEVKSELQEAIKNPPQPLKGHDVFENVKLTVVQAKPKRRKATKAPKKPPKKTPKPKRRK